MGSQTPSIKCPRSGRVLTPMSLDYWRFKKTLKTVLSSESENEDCDKDSVAVRGKMIMSHDRNNENRDGRTRDLKSHRRRPRKGNPKTPASLRKDKKLGTRLPTPLTQTLSNVAEAGTTSVSSAGKPARKDTRSASIDDVGHSSESERTPSTKSGLAARTDRSRTEPAVRVHCADRQRKIRWTDNDAEGACASDLLPMTPERGANESVGTKEQNNAAISPANSSTPPNNTPVLRKKRTRKARMVLFSDEDENGQHSTTPVDSGNDGVTLLENKLVSATLESSSSSSTSSLSADKENQELGISTNNNTETKDVGHHVVEISSDEDDLPSLAERVKVVPPKTPVIPNVVEKSVSTVTPARTKDISKLRTEKRLAVTEPQKRVLKTSDRSVAPASEKTTKTRPVKVKSQLKTADETFAELLDKLRDREDQQSDSDRSQADLNNTAMRWEITNKEDRHFVESLSENVPIKECHPDALYFRQTSFMAVREELTEKLYQLYDRTVFQNRFHEAIPVSWSTRLLTTAGLCSNKMRFDGRKYSEIELSTKVVDRPDRLRDTLIHEMCHAGAWIIHGYPGNHGPLFKFWGQRGSELLGLEVTTCHTYKIETKYVYRCQGCGYEVGRHSKSLDTERFVCGLCKGRFALFVNKPST